MAVGFLNVTILGCRLTLRLMYPRWTFWLIMIMFGISLVTVICLVPETMVGSILFQLM